MARKNRSKFPPGVDLVAAEAEADRMIELHGSPTDALAALAPKIKDAKKKLVEAQAQRDFHTPIRALLAQKQKELGLDDKAFGKKRMDEVLTDAELEALFTRGAALRRRSTRTAST